MNKSVAQLGVGGPVGSGKTVLLECLITLLIKQGIELAVVTNDLLTQEDAMRLKLKGFLPTDHIVGIGANVKVARAFEQLSNKQLAAIEKRTAKIWPDSTFYSAWG